MLLFLRWRYHSRLYYTYAASVIIALKKNINRRIIIKLTCSKMYFVENGKFDKIVQKAIKNQLIRQNRSFDWGRSEKNERPQQLKWSKSVDSPTPNEGDEIDNSADQDNSSTHNYRKFDRNSSIPNRDSPRSNKKITRNKNGLEYNVPNRPPIVTIKESDGDQAVPIGLPGKKDRLHRAITSVLSNNSDDITFDDMEVAQIVTRGLSDHLDFDINDDIEAHIKTAPVKANSEQETQHNSDGQRAKASNSSFDAVSTSTSSKGSQENNTNDRQGSTINSRPSTILDRPTRKLSHAITIDQETFKHGDQSRNDINQNGTTGTSETTQDSLRRVSIPVVVQPPTPKATHRPLAASVKKIKTLQEVIASNDKVEISKTESAEENLRSTSAFHDLRNATKSDPTKLSIEQIKKKYGKSIEKTRRVSFDVSVLRKKQHLDQTDTLRLPKRNGSGHDWKDLKINLSNSLGSGATNTTNATNSSRLSSSTGLTISAASSTKDNWLTVDRDSLKKRRKEGSSTDVTVSNNSKSLGSKKTSDHLGVSNSVTKRRSSYALDGRSKSSNELKNITINLGSDKKSSSTLQIDMKQVYKSLKRRNSSNRNIKASIESTSVSSADELKQRVFGNLISKATTTTAASTANTTTTIVSPTSATASAIASATQASNRASEHRRRTEDITRRFNEIKNANRDSKLMTKAASNNANPNLNTSNEVVKATNEQADSDSKVNSTHKHSKVVRQASYQNGQEVKKLPLTRTDGYSSITALTQSVDSSSQRQEIVTSGATKVDSSANTNNNAKHATNHKDSLANELIHSNGNGNHVNDKMNNIIGDHLQSAKSANSHNSNHATADSSNINVSNDKPNSTTIKIAYSDQSSFHHTDNAIPAVNDSKANQNTPNNLSHSRQNEDQSSSNDNQNNQKLGSVSNNTNSNSTINNNNSTLTNNKATSIPKIGRSRKLPSIDLAVKNVSPSRPTSSTTSISSVASDGMALPTSPIESPVSPVFVTPPSTPFEIKESSNFTSPLALMDNIEISEVAAESRIQSPPSIMIESHTGASSVFTTAPSSPVQSPGETSAPSPPNVLIEQNKLSESESLGNNEYPKLPAPPPPTPAQELSSAPVSDQEIEKPTSPVTDQESQKPTSPVTDLEEAKTTGKISKYEVADFFSQFTSQSSFQLRSKRANSLSLATGREESPNDDVKAPENQRRRMTTSDPRYIERFRNLNRDSSIENNQERIDAKSTSSDDHEEKGSEPKQTLPRIIITAPDSGDRKKRHNRAMNPYHRRNQKAKSKRSKERRERIRQNREDKQSSLSPTSSEDENNPAKQKDVTNSVSAVNAHFLSVDDSDWVSGCLGKDSESSCDEHDEKKKKKKGRKHRKSKSNKESKKKTKKSNHKHEDSIPPMDKNEEDDIIIQEELVKIENNSVAPAEQPDVFFDFQLSSSVIKLLKLLVKEEDITGNTKVFNLIETNLADEEGFYPLLVTLQNQLLNSCRYYFHDKCQNIITEAIGHSQLPAEYCTLL
ncbi:hypothetical protein TrispH2_006740 [Trichoplax sp. H2]|nr:hypothetical protein TrispH2_006740 [Trichoplax sp. H2]|eukprot:RDD40911.1 hypothetical protein TrispH2_006740 [Trichoplax sp. H2]